MNDIPDICILLNSRIGRSFAVGDVGVYRLPSGDHVWLFYCT